MRVPEFQLIQSDQFHPPISVLIDAWLEALALVDASVQRYLSVYYTTLVLGVRCWPKIASHFSFLSVSFGGNGRLPRIPVWIDFY
jgi:hypothetical protein